ncbi:hypothetical protein SAMN05216391_11874, partial [Lachnospiraceae bacterium KHCPX20]
EMSIAMAHISEVDMEENLDFSRDKHLTL